MGAAAEKLDDVTAGTADPAIVVDLEEHRRRRSRRSSRTASAISPLSYDSASEPGLYRYTAFGKTVEDSTTFQQPLRWKGRWFSSVAGGIYDVRARQWSPELGAFLAVDDFEWHDRRSTLWAWPMQNPVAFLDPTGHTPAGAAVGCLVGGAIGGFFGGRVGVGIALATAGGGTPAVPAGTAAGAAGGCAIGAIVGEVLTRSPDSCHNPYRGPEPKPKRDCYAEYKAAKGICEDLQGYERVKCLISAQAAYMKCLAEEGAN